MNDRLIVLLVEQHANVSPSLFEFVQAFPDVDVIRADRFQQAVEYISTLRRIDLLFCELILPGMMSGLDVAEVAIDAHPAIAVVMMSSDEAANLGSLANRCRVLQSPFGFEAIKSHVDNALIRLRLNS